MCGPGQWWVFNGHLMVGCLWPQELDWGLRFVAHKNVKRSGQQAVQTVLALLSRRVSTQEIEVFTLDRELLRQLHCVINTSELPHLLVDMLWRDANASLVDLKGLGVDGLE